MTQTTKANSHITPKPAFTTKEKALKILKKKSNLSMKKNKKQEIETANKKRKDSKKLNLSKWSNNQPKMHNLIKNLMDKITK